MTQQPTTASRHWETDQHHTPIGEGDCSLYTDEQGAVHLYHEDNGELLCFGEQLLGKPEQVARLIADHSCFAFGREHDRAIGEALNYIVSARIA